MREKLDLVPKNIRAPEDKILTFQEAVQLIREAIEAGLTIILAQGVFDIVHLGHIEYLRLAKEKADILIIGLENDNTVKLNKGPHRPYNNLEERLEFLSIFEIVDFVFGYEDMVGYKKSVTQFIERLKSLQPNMLAVSANDPNLDLKRKQTKATGVDLTIVNDGLINSTTLIAQLLGLE